MALLHQNAGRPAILGCLPHQAPDLWLHCAQNLPGAFHPHLASLIRSGVPILEVLQIVSQTVGNVIMEKAITTASLDIERGEGISVALSKHPVFPSMILRMITAGEQTGKIDNMLERISDFLDEEIETTLSGLTSLIEPILIVFLALSSAAWSFVCSLPIFKMPEIVSKR
jgi:type IV pilus assembly protein PilC